MNIDVINEMTTFLSEENFEKIESHVFKEEEYNTILDNIYKQASTDLHFEKDSTALSKICAFASQFTTILPEHEQNIQGYYIYNHIYIDEDLSDAKKITTIIHELSHHLYAQIFIQWMDMIIDADIKLIEAFVMFMLNNSIEDMAADEYVSYIIEGRFTPSECQNFLPFLQLLISNDIDVEESKEYFVFAHEISHDLQDVIDKVLTEDIKREIRLQFEVDHIEKINQQLKFDYSDIRFNTQEKLEIMKEMILFVMDYFVNDKGSIDQLIEYYNGFN